MSTSLKCRQSKNTVYNAASSPITAARFAREPYGTAIFGQINDPSIVSLDVSIDGVWQSYPVSQPGFVIRLPDDADKPEAVRWLDVGGRVIWSVEGDIVTR